MIKMFRVTNKQQAVWLQHAGKALKQTLLRRRIEIDHHVAAKDGVKRSGQRPAVVQQVEPL